jgi:hypothetical protein
VARWSKSLIAKQLEWSEACYREALLHHYGHLLNSGEKAEPIRYIKLTLKEKLGEEPISSDVNSTYLDNLRKLDTNQLELIIEAHNKGKQYRSPSTIDVLLSELFERATNPQKKKK